MSCTFGARSSETVRDCLAKQMSRHGPAAPANSNLPSLFLKIVLTFLHFVFGIVLQVNQMSRYGASLKHLILEACNILTIAVPPALPAGRFLCVFGLEISKARAIVPSIECIVPKVRAKCRVSACSAESQNYSAESQNYSSISVPPTH
jgi:hypothetical protein